MTTGKQTAANRANAAKSRGPLSAAGKAAAAKNAKKHGLTTPPDWSQVTKWYRIITENRDANPEVSNRSEEDRVTIALAEAEACAERARQAEAAHLSKMTRPLTDPDSINADEDLDLEDVGTLNFLLGQRLDPDMMAMLRFMKRVSPNRPAELRKTAQRLTRYRREAEARRHKALNAWISLKGEKNETKPNASSG